jgi:hypothetical protein
VLSFQHLTGTGDLASTFYGRVILAKIAALIVILEQCRSCGCHGFVVTGEQSVWDVERILLVRRR